MAQHLLEGKNRLQISETSRNIIRIESCLIMFAPFMKHIKPFATCEDNLRKLPFQKWRFTRFFAPRENPVRLGHQLFQRQALAINTIAFAELVQGLGRMEHEDMMRTWWGYDEDMMRIGKQNHKQNSHKLIQIIDSDEKSYPLDSITFSERFPWFPNPIYWGFQNFQIICSIDQEDNM